MHGPSITALLRSNFPPRSCPKGDSQHQLECAPAIAIRPCSCAARRRQQNGRARAGACATIQTQRSKRSRAEHPESITIGTNALLSLLVALAVWFSWRWWYLEKPRRALAQVSRHPHLNDLILGFVTNVLDTLGIGSFAPTTAVFKLQRRPADEDIPGTLNAGHAPPTFVEALI